MLIAGQANVPDRSALLLTARDKLSVGATEPIDRSARYRVDADPVRDDGVRALGTTGGQCQVVGARLCTKSHHGPG
jgi:hypothetical protein